MKVLLYNIKEFSANIGGGGFIVWRVIPDTITNSGFLGCSIRSCLVLIVFKVRLYFAIEAMFV